jgi:hypothetical protein
MRGLIAFYASGTKQQGLSACLGEKSFDSGKAVSISQLRINVL